MTRVKPYLESKYRVSTSHMYELIDILSGICDADIHDEAGNYEVLSLYYDTPNLEFLNDKIHGEFSKVKVRARFYRNQQNPAWHDPCLEIKQRKGHLVNKLRAYLYDKPLNSFVTDDIRGLILENFNDGVLLGNLAGKFLQPAIVVYYQRKALQFNGLEGLRFTFDKGLAGVLPSTDFLSNGFEFDSLSAMQGFGNIFEIKSYVTAPFSILNQLEKRGIHQQSFSKFASMLRFQLERSNDSRLVI